MLNAFSRRMVVMVMVSDWPQNCLRVLGCLQWLGWQTCGGCGSTVTGDDRRDGRRHIPGKLARSCEGEMTVREKRQNKMREKKVASRRPEMTEWCSANQRGVVQQVLRVQLNQSVANAFAMARQQERLHLPQRACWLGLEWTVRPQKQAQQLPSFPDVCQPRDSDSSAVGDCQQKRACENGNKRAPASGGGHKQKLR